MVECDDTASPNDESPSENDDSDVGPNYFLSDDSYSDSSDTNSSSLHEVSVCALNETQNVDLTIEKENKKPNSSKRKRTTQSEWKRNKTKLLQNTGHTYRNFQKVLKYLNG